ncbi:MAG: hypothetical protein HYW77_02275 [Parcubacteria group bacterium]|nr:hypothetical protein [Parcubacteria group bacterium]
MLKAISDSIIKTKERISKRQIEIKEFRRILIRFTENDLKYSLVDKDPFLIEVKNNTFFLKIQNKTLANEIFWQKNRLEEKVGKKIRLI